jgi:membrane protein
VYEALPGSGDVVRDSIQAVIQERGRMGTAGLIGLAWSASAAFAAATRAINRIQGNPETRMFVLARLRSLLVAAIAFLLLVVSVMLASVVESVLTSDRGWITAPLLEAQTLIWVLGWVSSLIIMFVVFALIYKDSPGSRTSWRAVWPGALLAAVITEVGKIAFLGYVERVANFEAVFGSLTSMMLLLLWLFLAAMALLVGVEYNIVRIQSP